MAVLIKLAPHFAETKTILNLLHGVDSGHAKFRNVERRQLVKDAPVEHNQGDFVSVANLLEFLYSCWGYRPSNFARDHCTHKKSVIVVKLVASNVDSLHIFRVSDTYNNKKAFFSL